MMPLIGESLDFSFYFLNSSLKVKSKLSRDNFNLSRDNFELSRDN